MVQHLYYHLFLFSGKLNSITSIIAVEDIDIWFILCCAFYLSPMSPLMPSSEIDVSELLRDLGALGDAESNPDLRDWGKREIPVALSVTTSDVFTAVDNCLRAGTGVKMIGGRTSATQAFGKNAPESDNVTVGIVPKSGMKVVDESKEVLLSNEVFLDTSRRTVRAGVGVTIGDINRHLAEKLGSQYQVLLDHTTVDSAFVGGVIAAGAQGPSRLSPLDVLTSLTVHTGSDVKRFTTREEMAPYVGMWGTTGAILEAEFLIHETAPYSFGTFIPLKGVTKSTFSHNLSQLLSILKPACDVTLADGKVTSEVEGVSILGVEILDKGMLTMQAEKNPQGSDDQRPRVAGGFVQSLDSSSSEVGVFVKGYASDEPTFYRYFEERLLPLCAGDQAVLGEDILPFSDPQELEAVRLVREAIPEDAKSMAASSKDYWVYSYTTDVNMRFSTDLPSDNGSKREQAALMGLISPFAEASHAFSTLQEEIQANNPDYARYFEMTDALYGHANPQTTHSMGGIDFHGRKIVRAPKDKVPEDVFRRVADRTQGIRKGLMGVLKGLPEKNPDVQISLGEKGLTDDARDTLSEEQKFELAQRIAASDSRFHGNVPQWLQEIVDGITKKSSL